MALSGRLTGFPPIAAPSARLLILGSMPGEASLAAAQYYAHPRNGFWTILVALLGLPADASYSRRVQALLDARIALWDVLESCVRPGSLDADIDPASVKANDFAGFYKAHPHIERVLFNGATAERLYRQRVQTTAAHPSGLQLLRLPSTSPAHAGLTIERKRALWLEAVLG